YYVISSSFKLLDFNQNVKDRYKGIERGDFCYKATMKRSTPCPHCPIAGNTEDDDPIYYDPFYRDWIQSVFTNIGDGIYAVTCRRAEEESKDLFRRLKNTDYSLEDDLSSCGNSENIGTIGGYCEEGFPLYYVNDSMVRMLGYDSKEDLEKGINGLVANTIHPDDMAQVIQDLGNEYYPGMSYETTYRMPRKDGSWFWTIDRGEVIETSDGRLAIISACIDVTKEREEKEMRQRETDASASRERILSPTSSPASTATTLPSIWKQENTLSLWEAAWKTT
ncbi:MAG: PAS domain-containing protein, partial [Candidatus Ornithospirochaeta sp.]